MVVRKGPFSHGLARPRVLSQGGLEPESHQEFNAPAPIDRIGSFDSGSGTSPSASVTTTLAGDLAVGILSTVSGTAVTNTSGWSGFAFRDDPPNTLTYAEDNVASSVGTYTSAPTLCWLGPPCDTYFGLEVVAFAGIPPLTTSTPVATPSSIDLGQTTTFSTSPSGGNGFYSTFTWGESSGLLGCVLANAASISCTPSATGTFQVTVKVTDTHGDSSPFETSADLVVSADPSTTFPFPSIPSADVGQSVTFSTSTSYGLTPYSYVWHDLPTGCSTSNVAALVCVPTGTGTFPLYVIVTDANHYSINSGTLDYTVDPTLTVGVQESVHSVDLGQVATFTATASGGVGPYGYVWHNLPGGCSGSTASITCSPTTSSLSIYVVVTDGNGNSITSGTLALNVFADPTIEVPIPSGPGADVGQKVLFSTTANFGATPYSYVWHGLPKGCTSKDVNVLACTPTTAGTFSVYVVLTDANGYEVTGGSLTFVVSHSLDIHTPGVNKNPAHLGQTVTFIVRASSMGKGPYTYSWSGLPGGCVSANSLTITCTLTGSTGTFHVSVTTTDANGASKTSAKLTFKVEPKLAVPSNGAPAAGGPPAFKIRD